MTGLQKLTGQARPPARFVSLIRCWFSTHTVLAIAAERCSSGKPCRARTRGCTFTTTVTAPSAPGTYVLLTTYTPTGAVLSPQVPVTGNFVRLLFSKAAGPASCLQATVMEFRDTANKVLIRLSRATRCRFPDCQLLPRTWLWVAAAAVVAPTHTTLTISLGNGGQGRRWRRCHNCSGLTCCNRHLQHLQSVPQAVCRWIPCRQRRQSVLHGSATHIDPCRHLARG